MQVSSINTNNNNNFKANIIFHLRTTNILVKTETIPYGTWGPGNKKEYWQQVFPNCIKMMNDAYKNLTTDMKKEVVGLWNKLYNMAKDKEIVYDINNNLFLVFPKDTIKNIREKSIEPPNPDYLVFLSDSVSFVKQSGKVNLKSLFNRMIEHMEKFDKNPKSIRDENDIIPDSIFGHKIFGMIDPGYENLVYDKNNFEYYFKK